MLHLSQVIDMQTHGNDEQASVELKRAIDAGLDHPAAHFNLGLIRAGEERYESAYRHLGKSVHHKDFALASHILLGECGLALDRYRDSAVHYLEAMRLAEGMVVPDDVASGLMQLYEPIIEAQNFEEDNQKLQQVSKNIRETLIREDWRSHLRTMREQTDASGISENPIPIADLLTKGTSNKIVEAMGRVRTLSKVGQLQAAMEEAFFALEESPTYLPLHMLIGELLVDLGNESGAVDKFMMIANSYQIRGETHRAVGMLKKVINMAPLDLDSREKLIELLIAQGSMDEALEEKLLLAEIHYDLAALDKSKEEYSKALKLAQRSGVDQQWQVRILHRLADIGVQSLDWRHALKLYAQIREANPSDGKAVQNLIDLNFRLGQVEDAMDELNMFIGYMNKTGNINQVIVMLENLVIERPEQPILHEYLGDAYKNNKQNDDAVTHLDKAGELYLENNDQMRAERAIRKIIELEPNNVSDYEELLRQLNK
jgi:tetratricopeptide (TPR) repeat protein